LDGVQHTDPGVAATTPTAPLWRNRDYLVLWCGQGVSNIGSQASALALPLLMLALTGSPAQAGVLGGLRGLAYVLFGLPAGALADRWNRKRVLILCDLGRAIAFASIPIAIIAGHLSAPQLYFVSFVEGTLFILFGLAETACVTRVVPAAQLPAAIAQNQASDATSTLVGPLIAGVLYSISRALPFVADAVSYTVSVASIFFIRTPLQENRTRSERRLRKEIGEGVRWIWRRPVLRLLISLNGGVNIIFGGWPILVIELAQRQGANAATIGLIFAGGGAGTVLGAVLAPVAQRRFTVNQIVIGVAWLFAITWPPYALAQNALTLGIVNALGFFFVPVTSGTQLSYRLLLVPDALQGRVNSVFRLTGFGGGALGFLITGLLLQWHGPVVAVWITFVPAVALAIAPTFNRSLRGVGKIATVA